MVKNKIKIIRESKNLSLKQLAEISELGKSTIFDTENYIKDPRLTTAVKIAKALEINFTELFDMSNYVE